MKKNDRTSEALAGSRNVDSQNLASAPVSSADDAHQRDRLVVICALIICSAFATALNSHFGSTPLEAIFAGIAIFSACLGLVGIQAQARRHAEIQSLKATIARFEVAPSTPAARDVAVPRSTSRVGAKDTANGPNAPALPMAIEPHARWEPARSDNSLGVPLNANDAAADRLAPQTPVQPPTTRPATIKAPTPSSAPRSTVGQTTEATLWPGTTLNVVDPMRDQWAFRPRDTAGAPSAQKIAEPSKGAAAPSVANAPSTIDADLAIVQQKIKALAEEVNAAENARQKLGSFETPQPQPLPSVQLAAPHVVIQSPVASAIDDSIDALKAVAASMLRNPPNFSIEPARPAAPVQHSVPLQTPAARAETSSSSSSSFGDLFIPASAQPIAVSSPAFTTEPEAASDRDFASVPDFKVPATATPIVVSAPVASAPVALAMPEADVIMPAAKPAAASAPARKGRAGEIANAIEAGRIDVMLSPIVDLQANNVTHYDLSFSIKTASGQNADSAEVEINLNGTELLALFDRARLVRAAGVAALLADKNKLGSVLSPITGRSMTNDSFLLEFARVFEEREGIANQLVLTFSQADVEQFSPQAWQSLTDMKAFGFRFALDQIDHLSADFKGLVRRGFAFAKLDAKALLSGMPSKERFLSPDEACRVLAGAGLTIVANGLADEKLRAQIFGFGVLYGQGQLFGAPRPVDVKIPSKVSRTAAA